MLKGPKAGNPVGKLTALPAGVQSRFLHGLSPQDLEVVLSAASHRQFFANAVVTTQEHAADHIFLLTRGRARHFFMTEDGRKTLLHWLVPGDVFGGAAFMSEPRKYLVSTETVEASSVLVWDRATIRGITARHPRVAENALLIAYEYMTWYIADHVALTSQSAGERLAHVLIRLSGVMGRAVPGGVEIDATNEELANAANITPFTASRLLNKWQRERAVEKHRGKLLVRSPGRLLPKAV
jgi:CRP-like cAMP-binding protein